MPSKADKVSSLLHKSIGVENIRVARKSVEDFDNF